MRTTAEIETNTLEINNDEQPVLFVTIIFSLYKTYSFITDVKGITVMFPVVNVFLKLPLSINRVEQIVYLDVSYMEDNRGKVV